ncbi:MAG: hypothetical protein HYV09_21420 [Deltaproteobacteria bacterium]|nr:hypothetical protein [Deltaproteobacteria bacterium]
MASSEHIGVGEPRGEALRAILDRRPLERDEVSVVLGQLGHALVDAHDSGLAHGALSTHAIFLTWDDGEPFARVFGFVAATEDYRHVRDDIVGLAGVATEIVGAPPPPGFDGWRARCLDERLTVRDCVAELRALFPLPGHRGGVPVGERVSTRRFEALARHLDVAAVRAQVLDRLPVGRLAIGALGIGVTIAVAALPTPPVQAPSDDAAAPPVSAPPAAAEIASSASSGPEQLAIDRANCPQRFVDDPMAAARNRSHRCVRAVLLPRILDTDAATLNDEQRHALKLACAALADLGCEMRVMP